MNEQMNLVKTGIMQLYTKKVATLKGENLYLSSFEI